jgi:hypothetical protein
MVYVFTLGKSCGLLAIADASHLLNEGEEEMGQTSHLDVRKFWAMNNVKVRLANQQREQTAHASVSRSSFQPLYTQLIPVL